ncbi:MAG: acyl-CoA dehydrogenase family protein [Variovorax sp.]
MNDPLCPDETDRVERKRLHVALQSIGALDAAWQKADAYAHESGRTPAPETLPASMRRILDTQRAWIDGARFIADRTAAQFEVGMHDADPKLRERALRWCALATPVLEAACTHQAFEGVSQYLQVFAGQGHLHEWGIEQLLRDARMPMNHEGTNETQAIDLVLRKVLPDGGAAMSGLLIELRDELDASRDVEADVQRRLAQLRYLGTSVVVATHADAALPCEVADDYLRVVMLAMLAWA